MDHTSSIERPRYLIEIDADLSHIFVEQLKSRPILVIEHWPHTRSVEEERSKERGCSLAGRNSGRFHSGIFRL